MKYLALLSPLLLSVVIFFRPCMIHNIFGEFNFCEDFIGGGGCGLSPTLSSLLCGKTCGFCPLKSKKELQESMEKNWKPIERVHYNDLSYEDFVENYKIPGVPLIIEGWLTHPKFQKMKSWNLNKLAEKCGHVPVSCKQRRVAAISMLTEMVNHSPFILKCIDLYLMFKYGTSLSDGLEDARTEVDLKTFIENIQQHHVHTIFSTPLDYLASAITVNDFPVIEMCEEFANDLILPEWSTRESLLFQDKKQDRRFSPNVFIEPDGGRAYPGHQHGYDLTHSFQVMLQGSKKLVYWPYSEAEHLYKSTITTENHDELFFAEGIDHHFDRFPAMAQALSFEGEVKEGDLLFIPCLGPHVFESNGPSLGIRFMHQDKHSITCGDELIKAKSTAVNEYNVGVLALFDTLKLDYQKESRQKTMMDLNKEFDSDKDDASSFYSNDKVKVVTGSDSLTKSEKCAEKKNQSMKVSTTSAADINLGNKQQKSSKMEEDIDINFMTMKDLSRVLDHIAGTSSGDSEQSSSSQQQTFMLKHDVQAKVEKSSHQLKDVKKTYFKVKETESYDYFPGGILPQEDEEYDDDDDDDDDDEEEDDDDDEEEEEEDVGSGAVADDNDGAPLPIIQRPPPPTPSHSYAYSATTEERSRKVPPLPPQSSYSYSSYSSSLPPSLETKEKETVLRSKGYVEEL